ncbi:MAG: hypothetical protein E7D27_11270 [Clostridium celatum]|nr:hypothetical protein [Clostridium celatum]
MVSSAKDLIERVVVIIMTIIALIISIKINFRIDLLGEYQTLLSNTISFSSIFIGVLMTLVGLLLGYVNKEVIKKIRIKNANDLLVKYFIFPILAGVVVVAMSLILGVLLGEKAITNQLLLNIISKMWFAMTVYFILSTIRVIWLMLIILKEVFQEDIEEEKDKKVEKIEINECAFDEVDY